MDEMKGLRLRYYCYMFKKKDYHTKAHATIHVHFACNIFRTIFQRSQMHIYIN